MKISYIQTVEGMVCLQGVYEDTEIRNGYTSDLLSDVMANAEEGSVLITIQAHKNTIAVAALTGIPAIILCNNRPVSDEMLDAAKKENIAIFRTSENQFNTTVLIARHLANSSA